MKNDKAPTHTQQTTPSADVAHNLASSGNALGAAALDPLNQSYVDVDTDYPLLKAGQIGRFRVAASELKPGKDPASPRRWSLKLEALAPLLDVDGKSVDRAVIYEGCMLGIKGAMTAEMLAKNFAKILQGFKVQQHELPSGATSVGALINTIDSWHNVLVGKTVDCTIKLNPKRTGDDGKEYDASNSVGKYL